ncbi:MAG: oligopeptidase A [Gammaproteobacteria bacterium]|nr:oligopeptidase A [Gammaproteobacteria bacterium]
MDAVLLQARAELDELVAGEVPALSVIAEKLEALLDKLNNAWSPIRHLHAVAATAQLRAAYRACLPKVSAFHTEADQHPGLFQALSHLQTAMSQATGTGEDGYGEDGYGEDEDKRAWLDYKLQQMRLSGAGLDEAARQRFAEITLQLAQLTNRFSENVLDASQTWQLHIENIARLDGLPQDIRNAAVVKAQHARSSGALLTLDFPVFAAVMGYAQDRRLREKLHRVWVTRASEQPPSDARFDNTALMGEILKLRHDAARLLGFDTYADRSLATKMATSAREVVAFLRDLNAKVKPYAQAELAQLQRFARERDGLDTLESWDVSYYTQRWREEALGLDVQALRAYFPIDRVLHGLFTLLSRLFGIGAVRCDEADTWHPDVRLFRVHGDDNTTIGYIYLDLYARQGKRGGAWMDECRSKHHLSASEQLPVAYLTCNFTPPIPHGTALLTHDEVLTLFHEIGHCLHHLLTEVDYPSIGGINGVAWDAVELPSQLLEYWCWEPQALALMTAHIDTGAPLPAAAVSKLRAARTFMSALAFVRQLEFALFDMRLHMEYEPANGAGQVQAILGQVRAEVAVVRPPPYTRFEHSFTHIFAGGYAAGYYSYKWAEVLASDAFSLFEERGVFNADVGRAFRAHVLARGGSRDAAQLYRAFRGRDPHTAALLRHHGLALHSCGPGHGGPEHGGRGHGGRGQRRM